MKTYTYEVFGGSAISKKMASGYTLFCVDTVTCKREKVADFSAKESDRKVEIFNIRTVAMYEPERVKSRAQSHFLFNREGFNLVENAVKTGKRFERIV